jgi:membrane protein
MRRRLRSWLDLWVDLFARHDILTYASAIAFRGFVALLALTLLGLALLGATGHQSIWNDRIAPQVAGKLTIAAYGAVNDAVQRILTGGTTTLITFASILTLWQVSSAIRTCMGALNRIYDADEARPGWIRWLISVGLAVCLTVALFGSFVLAVGLRHAGSGDVHWLVAVARWIGIVVLLWAAVTLLVRFAPAERRAKRWVSAGGALVVVSWIVTSLAFGLFVSRIANFRTAEGDLAAFFILASYLYAAAIVFLVGEQLDELARVETRSVRRRR